MRCEHSVGSSSTAPPTARSDLHGEIRVRGLTDFGRAPPSLRQPTPSHLDCRAGTERIVSGISPVQCVRSQAGRTAPPYPDLRANVERGEELSGVSRHNVTA